MIHYILIDVHRYFCEINSASKLFQYFKALKVLKSAALAFNVFHALKCVLRFTCL